MSQYQPRFLIEGPATACVLHGVPLGWANCTCLSFAMGIDAATLGKIRISGCQVRDETGDYVGGTTIPQNAAVALAHGVTVEQHVGPNVCTPVYAATKLQSGRGIALSGNTIAIGKGNVNHNIWVNSASGGVLGKPQYGDVFDPWSQGPALWSWTKINAFAAALRPWGEGDSRTLGAGKFYSAIFPLPTRPASLWGADVPANLQAVDPEGDDVAFAIRNRLGLDFRSLINMTDLWAAFRKANIPGVPKSVIDPGDVLALTRYRP